MLTQSVGDSGKNSRRDVAKTEKLLGDAKVLDLKQTDGPTGYWGMRTSDATKKFQQQNGLKVDGQIKPKGPTVQKLAQVHDAAKRRKERRKPSKQEQTEPPKKCPKGTYLSHDGHCVPIPSEIGIRG